MDDEAPRFYRITLIGGRSYVQPERQMGMAVAAELDGLDEGGALTLVISRIRMTQAEYDALPEFEGH